MSSKGQGLSLSTIVIAVIVLVVLIILVMMLTGYFGNRFRPAFGAVSDTSCNGRVIPDAEECNPSTEKSSYAAEVPSGSKCCAKKTCEERGGRCCGTGSGTIDRNYWSCKDVNGAGPNCCGF